MKCSLSEIIYFSFWLLIQVAHKSITNTSACCQHPMQFCEEYVRVTWHDKPLCHVFDKAIPLCRKKQTFFMSMLVCGCAALCLCSRCSFTVTYCFNLSGNPHRLYFIFYYFGIVLCSNWSSVALYPRLHSPKELLHWNMKYCDVFFIALSFDKVWVSLGFLSFLSFYLLSSSSVYSKTNYCCCCQKHKRHLFLCA